MLSSKAGTGARVIVGEGFGGSDRGGDDAVISKLGARQLWLQGALRADHDEEEGIWGVASLADVGVEGARIVDELAEHRWTATLSNGDGAWGVDDDHRRALSQVVASQPSSSESVSSEAGPAAVVVSLPGGMQDVAVDELGGRATVRISLSMRPRGEVDVPVWVSDRDRAEIRILQPESVLTFDEANWDVPQAWSCIPHYGTSCDAATA